MEIHTSPTEKKFVGGLATAVVQKLVSGSSCQGSGGARLLVHCVVFLVKTLYLPICLTSNQSLDAFGTAE